MSTSYPESYQLKFCPFPPSFNTNSQYICFKYEKCCPQGCCYSYSFSYFQSWYFWLVIVLFFLIFYSASWYCKKLEIERKRRAQAISSAGVAGFPPTQNSPRRNHGNNVDNLLESLMQTYRARHISETRRSGDKIVEPPPKYRDALGMPKVVRNNVQVVEIHVNGNSSNGASGTEEPPTYDDATNVQRSAV